LESKPKHANIPPCRITEAIINVLIFILPINLPSIGNANINTKEEILKYIVSTPIFTFKSFATGVKNKPPLFISPPLEKPNSRPVIIRIKNA
jgi:hypothetical protein